MAERTLTYQEAVQEGLAFNPSTSSQRKKYYDILGGGDRNVGKQVYRGEQFKSEQFWKDSFAQFQNVASLTNLNRAKTLLTSAKERTARATGAEKATSTRAMRSVGGLLSGVKSPSLGESQTTGPMLGDDTMLGQQSMLGSRRRM